MEDADEEDGNRGLVQRRRKAAWRGKRREQGSTAAREKESKK